MNASSVKISDTRFPALTRAVLASVDRESLVDVCNHGADSGFPGFTYYRDTVAFAKKHKTAIMQRLGEDVNSMGEDSICSMMAHWKCLEGCKPDEIAEALWNPKSELRQTVYNALAWYALEEVARELNPDL